MRNTNTSFVKNAISRFGNEASEVLRVYSDTATLLQRLMHVSLRMPAGLFMGNLPTSYRPMSSLADTYGTCAETAGLSLSVDRHKSTEYGESIIGQQGFGQWCGQSGQTVS